MDLNEIDLWSREILQKEARRRGIRTPEMYSRGQLVKLILRHEYRSTLSVREAARVVGGIWGSAKLALRVGLGLAEARLEREFGHHREPEHVPPRRFEVPAVPRPRVDVDVDLVVDGDGDDRRGTSPSPSPSKSTTTTTSTSTSTLEQPSAAAEAASAAEPAEIEQLSYGPQRDSGVSLQWSVGDAAIHRARAVLGAQGELALRVITVRVEDGLYVRTETLDHGPIDSSGDWTAPLTPNARYVSSVGLRSGDRFVSIVHAAS